MKKLLILLSCVATGLCAAPVLDPAAPALNTDGLFYCCPNSCWSLRAAFRGDYVFNRKLQDTSHSIDQYSLYSNEGVLTLNLWERADIYAFVGATNQSLASKYTNAAATVDAVGIEYQTEGSWGAGLKLILWQWDLGHHCGRSFLTAAFDYEAVSRANPVALTVNGAADNASSVPSVNYRESQVTLALVHKIKKLLPYIALKWTNARANMDAAAVPITTQGDTPITFQGLQNQQKWGWALGCSLVDVGRMTVSAEARFVDEKAMTITGAVRF